MAHFIIPILYDLSYLCPSTPIYTPDGYPPKIQTMRELLSTRIWVFTLPQISRILNRRWSYRGVPPQPQTVNALILSTVKKIRNVRWFMLICLTPVFRPLLNRCYLCCYPCCLSVLSLVPSVGYLFRRSGNPCKSLAFLCSVGLFCQLPPLYQEKIKLAN